MITDYNHLSIGKYLEIHKIAKEEMNDIDKQVAMIAILSDMSEGRPYVASIRRRSSFAS